MHIGSRIVVSIAALMMFAGGAQAKTDKVSTEAKTSVAAMGDEDKAKTNDPMICERVKQIGSLLRSKKVCMRKSQWEEQRRGDRANIERSQVQRGLETAH
ncbi:hypothetical protein [Novosphingobium beihaiensis]|uniref:Secreted protein n=1 Tax=Novosphingobium beihaiensis TaxID=2930389 RepID=A0ABT0BU04_9SPHN|nr:hypothetical protein [Novosphingobium beihaiensis]MCJ2188159.1 hypothetical protein [Novosphingobium beihaiensis]